MGWADYNRKKNSAKTLFAKLKNTFTRRELEEMAICREQLMEMIYIEIESELKEIEGQK